MEFVSTGDEFCRCGNSALEGVDMCTKIVYDVFVWNIAFEEYLNRLRQILVRFWQFRVTIKRKKFVLAKPSNSFCGYGIPNDDVHTDPTKNKATANFPVTATYFSTEVAVTTDIKGAGHP